MNGGAGCSERISLAVFAPAWIWWVFTCHSGAVTPKQSVGGYTSIVLGGNVSAGFTIKVDRIIVDPSGAASD